MGKEASSFQRVFFFLLIVDKYEMGASGHRGGKQWQVVAMIMANQSTHCILDSTYMCCNTFLSSS